MTEYAPGDQVDIVIKGARVTAIDGTDLEYQYRSELGVVESHVALDSPGVTVERVAPAEWPPRPGDLWRTPAGTAFFAIQPDDSVLLTDVDGEEFAPDQINRLHGPLTLVHREDEGGERP